jgi:hypothetical protein
MVRVSELTKRIVGFGSGAGSSSVIVTVLRVVELRSQPFQNHLRIQVPIIIEVSPHQ